MEPYTFHVTYIKGKENAVPDALSRTPEFYEVKAIELCPPEVHQMVSKDDMKEARDQDERYLRLCNDPSTLMRLKMRVNGEGFLETEEGQWCVPNNDALQYKLALEAHEPFFSGHFGLDKTLTTVQRHWWWPTMINVVKRVVMSCPMC